MGAITASRWSSRASSSMHHFMVELGSLDDVGQGYDLAQIENERIAYTLGRHTNDHMTSFYMRTPSGFFIEYGWGGRVIEPQGWQPWRCTTVQACGDTSGSTCRRISVSTCARCASMRPPAAFARRCHRSIARGSIRFARSRHHSAGLFGRPAPCGAWSIPRSAGSPRTATARTARQGRSRRSCR